ncbi:hypothetical protein [Pseudomonas khavaziana]|nr:hypothetical protein [Pseudomonas khavaziana]MBV4483078.1 hypothetical protein [Pseudomonas khavaziana]
MLAKIVNDNAANLEKCDALAFFASKLAPTEYELDGSLIITKLEKNHG